MGIALIGTQSNISQALALQPVVLYAHEEGTKLTRLYGNWYYLESLPSGRHQITVSLNTNDHRALTHQGQPIEATIVLDVP